MSLSRFLLEEGVEMEINAEMRDVIALLDRELPNIAYDGYGYQISSIRGALNSRWKLLVKSWDRVNAVELAPTLGFVMIENLKGGGISFRIPPRNQWGDEEARAFDEDGKIFASFIFQILNIFHSSGFIDLPEQLPVR